MSTQDDRSQNQTKQKRVSVACDSCRQLKVKCSGEPSNGGSCDKCIKSGKSEQCRFLRVGSENGYLRLNHDDSQRITYQLPNDNLYQGQQQTQSDDSKMGREGNALTLRSNNDNMNASCQHSAYGHHYAAYGFAEYPLNGFGLPVHQNQQQDQWAGQSYPNLGSYGSYGSYSCQS